MQPINIFNSQDVKVTIDENGTPVDVYISGGTATELQFYSTFSALPSPGQGGIIYITEDTNFIYRWDGSYIQIGGGSPSLQDVTDVGNTTTNDIQLINDADVILGAGGKVLMDNGSKLQEGTTDAGNGGSKGIALKCSIDYELKWEAGRLYTMEQDGFTIREVSHNFTFVPSVNDDSLKGFTIGSRWILDNGDIYTCSDATSGAAVWELNVISWGDIQGTLSNQTDLQNALDDKVPYTGATGNINIGVYNIVANDGTSDSEFAPNFVGVENASGYTVIDPTGLYTADGSGQMEVNPQGLIFPDASVQTTAGISGVDWGDIQGTLSYQTDLQSALDGKVDENSAITGATKTKITYDSKGLVTSGADAAISDISGLQTELDGKVPYTGATGNVNLGEYGLTGGYYQFDTTPTTYTQAVGNVGWNDTEGTIETLLKGGSVVLEIGQKLVARVVNGTGGNVLMSNYQVVKVTGAQGQRLQVNLAQGNNDANSADTLGLIAENISNNQSGFIVTSGIISEINTTGSLQSETWADGDPLYLSPTTAGKVTNVKPQAPNHTVIIGFVVYAHSVHGKIFVKIDNGYELDELHNVKINTPLNGQVLRYNGTTFVWENSNDSDNLTFNAPLSRSVNAISISQASASANGYLSSSDWSTFNSKEPALTKGNLTESTSSVLTITGGSSAVIGSGTTIQVKQSSSTQSGFLSSTDWSTFNGKQNALTNPVTGTGTNNEIAYFNTTGSTIGSLSTATYPSLTELSYVKGVTSAIQTQLNGKQATLTNPITGTGTSGQIAYFTASTSQSGSNNLFWDATNNRLGIGTSAPDKQFHIKGDSTSSNIVFETTGYTTKGYFAQYLGGTLQLSINRRIDGVFSNTNSATASINLFGDNGISRISLFTTNTNNINPSETLRVFGNGNILIQTGGTFTDNGYKLDVNGIARIQGIILSSDASNLGFYTSRGNNHLTQNAYYDGTWKSYGSTASYGSAVLISSDGANGNALNILTDTSISAANESLSFTNLLQLKTNGNLVLGTTTDSGYKLDVNGTARVQGSAGIAQFFLSDTLNNFSLTFYKNASSAYLIESSSTSKMSYGYSGNYWATFNGSQKSLALASATSEPTPATTAILDLQSTTKGFLPPRMTGAQGEAIVTPATGLMIYTTSAGTGAITSAGWWGYNGTTWVRLN